MAIFNNYLLGMDLTPMDDALLEYIHFWIGEDTEDVRLHLVHNIKYALDEDMEALLDAPLSEVIEEALQEKVDELIPSLADQVTVHVFQEPSTSAALLAAVESTDADLMVLGKKIDIEGSGITNSKLLRQCPKPVLLVPETARKKRQEILSPIDFSKRSAAALHMALDLQKQWAANLEVQHIYHIPSVYFPYIPVKSMTRSMLATAKEEYHEFQQKYKLTHAPACVFTDGKDQSVVDTLDAYTRSQGKDLIIIGKQGHSALVGSVAIGLSRLDNARPILMV